MKPVNRAADRSRSKPQPPPLAVDILAQPEAFRRLAEEGPARWDKVLTALGDLGRFRRVVFTGMGSSYFASLAAAGALAARGFPAAAELSSALLHGGGDGRLRPDDLLVVVSQSGESAEAVRLLESPGPRPVLAVTGHPESSLGRRAAAVLEFHVPPDHGVAVKTYGASLLALLYLVARLTGLPVSDWIEGVRRTADGVAQANERGEAWRALGGELVRYPAAAVTARGLSMSAAMAGALLFNEVPKVPAWAEDGGEFRHGVIEVADPGFLAVVILTSGPTAGLGVSLIRELAATGARVLAVAPDPLRSAASAAGATVLPVAALEEPFAPPVQTVPFQWLCLGWAEARGFEPGRFRNTPGVVRSEGGEVTSGAQYR